MQLVTLTTDWGTKDWYNGQIKGRLYSEIEDVNVVDINHNIDKFDLNSTAIVVKNSCLHFPENTIHIIDVNTYEDKDKAFVVIKYNGQYYICTDNGLPSIVFRDLDVEITDLSFILAESNYYTFAVLDVFVKVASIIAKDKSTANIGNRVDNFAVIPPAFLPVIRANSIECQIIYIDDYGNSYLNIDDITFEKILNGRSFELTVDVGCTIRELSASYADKVVKGRALLTVSSMRNLELAVREDNFARLMGMKVGSKIVIHIK